MWLPLKLHFSLMSIDPGWHGCCWQLPFEHISIFSLTQLVSNFNATLGKLPGIREEHYLHSEQEWHPVLTHAFTYSYVCICNMHPLYIQVYVFFMHVKQHVHCLLYALWINQIALHLIIFLSTCMVLCFWNHPVVVHDAIYMHKGSNWQLTIQ